MMCDIPPNYGLPFSEVRRNILQQVLSSPEDMIRPSNPGYDLDLGNLFLCATHLPIMLTLSVTCH